MKKTLLLCTLGLVAVSALAMQQQTPTTAQKAAVAFMVEMKLTYAKLQSEL
jgi:hypothetical protein